MVELPKHSIPLLCFDMNLYVGSNQEEQQNRLANSPEEQKHYSDWFVNYKKQSPTLQTHLYLRILVTS
jgi:hypothetical protein